ncbi:MAG: hypothetical protein IJP29_06030 [Lachnospiraceae bacterium]|nr:hypothetical protein [Lachnospiraceae bacterium]
MLERTLGPWDYRMMPNKMLELVKNVGNMEQEHTGYYVDSESEMLTILAYLNYGETTNITEGMIEQIEEAVRTLEARRLRREDEYDIGGRKLGDDEYLGREDFALGEDRFGNNDGRTLGRF